jgi:LacI family transcriptional regulator
VRQPLSEIGAIATRMVLDLAESIPLMRRVNLATDLVVRESTAPPPK